jgi:hypothetical protein
MTLLRSGFYKPFLNERISLISPNLARIILSPFPAKRGSLISQTHLRISILYESPAASPKPYKDILEVLRDRDIIPTGKLTRV